MAEWPAVKVNGAGAPTLFDECGLEGRAPAPAGGKYAPAPPRTTSPYGGCAPHRGVDTSRFASESIQAVLTGLQERVLAFIVSRGAEGATDHEIVAGTGLLKDTAAPRRKELVEMWRGEWRGSYRPTPSGRPARVWVAAGVTGKGE